jgi:hypothetical protein
MYLQVFYKGLRFALRKEGSTSDPAMSGVNVAGFIVEAPFPVGPHSAGFGGGMHKVRFLQIRVIEPPEIAVGKPVVVLIEAVGIRRGDAGQISRQN